MQRTRSAIGIAAFLGVLLLGWLAPAPPAVLAQQPTGSIATVTGTPSGPTIKVDSSLQQVYVYAGPSSFDYPAIGILLGNETAPALGRAQGREEWIQIYYPGVPGSTGWVWSLEVRISPGARLPLVEVPATPTPNATPTINPTLVERYVGEQTPTRLPTFTPPSAPIDEPIFTDQTETQGGIPTGLLILSLGLFGFFGAVISYLRGR